MSTREQRKRAKIRRRAFLVGSISSVLIFIIGTTLFFKLRNEHYRKNTFIQGINCSWLTVQQAEEKINNSMANQNISFYFSEQSYSFPANTIGLKLASTSDLESILEKQRNGDKTQEYSLDDAFTFDKKLLKENVLNKIDSLKEENMKHPQNASLTLSEDGLLEIIPEESGNLIDFEEAYLLTCATLRDGITTVDCSEITLSEPEIKSSDETLNSQKYYVNDILSTIVKIALYDGTIVTLDHSTMKDWIIQDENGVYDVDIDSNLPSFVSALTKTIQQTDSTLIFSATGIGNVPVPCKLRLDTNKQIESLKTKLLQGGTFHCIPEYDSNLDFTSYVELDLSRQTVWMYYNGECIVETPCVTGDVSDGNATPPGLFYLTYKTTDTYLRGYNNDGTRYKSHVDYWMPFNGGIGLHDASWRNKFGGTIYKNNGSHGCVNLPLNAAKTIYEHIDNTMPIVVYSSEK